MKKSKTINIEMTKKKYSSTGELSKCSDDYLVSLFNRYYSSLQEGRIFIDYRPTVLHNLEKIQTILRKREERRRSSSPEQEIENILSKLEKERVLLQSLEEKIRKIERQKEDLNFKIKRQEERLATIRSILERQRQSNRLQPKGTQLNLSQSFLTKQLKGSSLDFNFCFFFYSFFRSRLKVPQYQILSELLTIEKFNSLFDYFFRKFYSDLSIQLFDFLQKKRSLKI